jgi:Papain fold toxin 1, glutamine deamidase
VTERGDYPESAELGPPRGPEPAAASAEAGELGPAGDDAGQIAEAGGGVGGEAPDAVDAGTGHEAGDGLGGETPDAVDAGTGHEAGGDRRQAETGDDRREAEPAEGEPAEGEPAEGEPAEGEPGEGEPGEGEPAAATDSRAEAASPAADRQAEDPTGGREPQPEQDPEPGQLGPADQAEPAERAKPAKPAEPADNAERDEPPEPADNAERDEPPEPADNAERDEPPEPADNAEPDEPPEADEPDDAQRQGDTGESQLGYTDVSARYPEDYAESEFPPPEVEDPHAVPEGWTDQVNRPGMSAPGRDDNCPECARAVQSTWAGEPGNAAAMRQLEPTSRMTEFAGVAPASATMDQVAGRLTDLGPGSSAIVGFDRVGQAGHWFNAVNDGGTIKAVDGQSGLVESWPPSKAGLGFDESGMVEPDAIYFGPDGRVIR